LNSDVISQETYNKMGTQNIAICFAPCVMRAKEMSIKEFIYARKSVEVMQMLLSNFEGIFGSEMVRN
jgi:hypothetical protein